MIEAEGGEGVVEPVDEEHCDSNNVIIVAVCCAVRNWLRLLLLRWISPNECNCVLRSKPNYDQLGK